MSSKAFTLKVLASEKERWEQAARESLRSLALWLRYNCNAAVESPPRPMPDLQRVDGDRLVLITPRAKPEELAAWRGAAERRQQEFSAWIRNACNAAVEAARKKARR